MGLVARLVSSLAVVGALAGAAGCSAAADDDATNGAAASAANDVRPATLTPVTMTDAERKDLVEKKATCPFVGAVTYLKKLTVLSSLGNPLARISDIAALGDAGGGDLGSTVLSVFARGNHHRMHGIVRDASGASVYTSDLTEDVLPGTFSLDFPKSQGTHPGHSGMLQAGTKGHYHGALDRAAVDRLLARAVDAGGDKVIKRSDIGAFIWENVSADPESVYLLHGFSAALLADLRALHASPSIAGVVKLSGTDNLVGSSGEFGLLMTLLEQPDTKVDGEPVIRVDDVNRMFVDKQLPDDWASRPKTGLRWVENTMAILAAAEGDRFASFW